MIFFPRKLLNVVVLLGVVLASARIAASAEPYRLIGHRGGVVEDKFPDNSAAALQGAAARGYAGVEVDIRETRDGVLVMQHDPDLTLNFADPRKIEEITWEQLRGLRSKVADQHVWKFEDVVRAAKSAGLILMLDSKDPHSPDFVQKVEAVLKDQGMLDRCYIIGTADALKHFLGKAPVGLKYRSLRPKVEADATLAGSYFLFDEGRTLTEEMVRWAQSHHVKVVPSINVYHYYDPATMTGKSRDVLAGMILPQAKRHIEQLQAWGVTEFQIDSEFDQWFVRSAK